MMDKADIKEAEFYKREGFSPFKRKEWREERLTGEDWYQEGGAIWLRPRGQHRLLVAEAVEEDMPLAMQRFVEMRTIRPAKNPKVIYCNHDGKKVPVFFGKFAPRYVKRKKVTVQVQVIEGDDGTTYRFAKCAP